MKDRKLEFLVDYYHEHKLSHAYLLETNNLEECFLELKGVIKKIFCEHEYTDNCQKCNICNLVDQNFLPSLQIIDSNGSIIKKEQVLELKRMFSTVPIYTKNNVYIIKGAEMLNASSANTMLKFIEEPEENIIGFFITNNLNNVISTVQSRCEIIKVFYDVDGINLDNLITNNDEMFNVAIEYLKKIELEKKDFIMYNGSVLLNKYKERDDFKRLFKIVFLIYQSKYEEKSYDVLKFLDNLNKKELLKRLKLVNYVIDALNSNMNIDLLLDKFIIELGEVNG